MPEDTTISGLAAYGEEHGQDLLVVVDTTDPSMAPSGTDKRATVFQLFGSPPAGSILTWAGDPTGIPNPVPGLDAGYF